MKFFRTIPRAAEMSVQMFKMARRTEDQAALLGRMFADAVKGRTAVRSLRDVEFKVFSQWGDDGIIQWLVSHLAIEHKTFIEFGVEDYRESNTRFLMVNDNWSGLVMDGSPANVRKIMESEYYWRYDLKAKAAFVSRDNINALISSAGFPKEVGILNVDVDGNDYWIWEAINVIEPVIVVVEYNAVFGSSRAITIPYNASFIRSAAHSSRLYYGASLQAFDRLAQKKGYAFVGCNSAGNNAYFVRRDKLNDVVKSSDAEQGFVDSKFRESADARGNLTFLSGESRLKEIAEMPVVNVDTGETERL